MRASPFDDLQKRGFLDLLALCRELGESGADATVWTVGHDLFKVETHDRPEAARATLLGPALVAPQEYGQLSSTVVDVGKPPSEPADAARLAEQLLAEIRDACAADASSTPRHLAYRGARRYARRYEPLPLAEDARPRRRLREGGVYLLTGGFGGVGLHLAHHLAEGWRAKLALLGRRAPGDAERQAVAALEELGSEVLELRADVADAAQLEDAIDATLERFGRLDGVLHLAGSSGERSFKLLPELDAASALEQLEAKVRGALHLEAALESAKARHPRLAVDFCLLFSSNVSVLGGLGAAAYSAANLALDALAERHEDSSGTAWISANWDGWLLGEGEHLAAVRTSLDAYAMTPAESRDAWRRAVELAPAGRLVVSTGDLHARLALWIDGDGEDDSTEDALPAQPRPDLGTHFAPPESELEKTVARVWGELLGVEELGVDDNFFDLGGSSLIGLKVVAALKKELGREIAMVKLFEGPTVRAFARLLEDAGEGGATEQAVATSAERGARRRQRRSRRKAKDVNAEVEA